MDGWFQSDKDVRVNFCTGKGLNIEVEKNFVLVDLTGRWLLVTHSRMVNGWRSGVGGWLNLVGYWELSGWSGLVACWAPDRSGFLMAWTGLDGWLPDIWLSCLRCTAKQGEKTRKRGGKTPSHHSEDLFFFFVNTIENNFLSENGSLNYLVKVRKSYIIYMAIRTEYSHGVLQTWSTYKYEPHSVALTNSLTCVTDKLTVIWTAWWFFKAKSYCDYAH